MWPRARFGACIAALLLLAACGQQDSDPAPPETLRVGVLPDQGTPAIRASYTPLFQYLSEQTGLPYEFVPSGSYAELVEQFVRGEVNLAFMGGVTFLRAELEGGVVPIAMRDIDMRFTTLLVARTADPGRKVEDFQGRPFSFGSRLSTSGHFMARYFLEERGIDPEHFFTSVTYSRAHDETVYAVRDGQADLGAVSAAIFRAMLSDGRSRGDDMRIVWETPTYPDYVWAGHPSLGQPLMLRIREALLALTPRDPVQAEILEKIGAQSFLPAAPEDFAMLSQIAERSDFLSDKQR